MRGLRDAFAYEWVRIRTIRSTWWLTVLTLVFAYGVTVLSSWAFSGVAGKPPRQGGPSADDLSDLPHVLATQFGAVPGVPYVVPFLLAMIGVLAWGHEYRHGMIRATLTALSSRTAAWVAKTVVALAWVAAVTAVAVVGSWLLAWAFLHAWSDFGVTSLLGLVGRAALYAVLFSAFGMALTSLLRNQTAGLVLLYLWPLAIETVVQVVFLAVPPLRDHQDLTRFLPFDAGGRVLDIDVGGDGDGLFGDPLSATGGGLVMGLVVALLLALGFALFSRRDA